MLTVAEAIEKRRSIRKFKTDAVSDELLAQVLEAGRLAPSGTNRQPWRFQVIKPGELKDRFVEEAVIGNPQVAQAPIVIVCGSELLTFVKGHKLAPPGSEYFGADSEDFEELRKFLPDAHMYTAIAVEHMALMATALGLGSCWVQRVKFGQAARVLGWPRSRVVLTLLLIGYADEDPPARPRSELSDIVVEEAQSGG